MRGSLFRSAYELFYTAVAPADKRAVKSVIDVGADRMGDAVGAGAVGLLLVLLPGRSGAILAAACVCSVIRRPAGRSDCATAMCWRSKRAWSIAPSNSIRRMVEDSTTLSVLMQTAHLPDAVRAAASRRDRLRARTASHPTRSSGSPANSAPATRREWRRPRAGLVRTTGRSRRC